jgi:hypothetical protein
MHIVFSRQPISYFSSLFRVGVKMNRGVCVK